MPFLITPSTPYRKMLIEIIMRSANVSKAANRITGLLASHKKGRKMAVNVAIGNLLSIPEIVGSKSPMSYTLPPVS